jgi:hypothetical protein
MCCCCCFSDQRASRALVREGAWETRVAVQGMCASTPAPQSM